MKYLKYLFLVVFIGLVASCSDDDNDAVNENRPLLPKKELRGVWVATAWWIDWPMGIIMLIPKNKSISITWICLRKIISMLFSFRSVEWPICFMIPNTNRGART